MTSIKVKFRESRVKDKDGTIYYQLIHNLVKRETRTSYKIFAEEWNEQSQSITERAESDRRGYFLQAVKSSIKFDLNRLQIIVNSLEAKGEVYETQDVITIFQNQAKGETIFNFGATVVARLKQLGKNRSAETYSSTLVSFMKFREGEDIALEVIDSDLMQTYESFLKNNGVSPNTISFYMRILRAIYNRAVEKELIQQRHPFKKVYTGMEKTVKRAISIKYLKKINELDLTLSPNLELIRDMFMFSFLTRGMSFVDMAYLTNKNITNGILTYRRRKTNQQLHIKWENQMQKIVDKYTTSGAQYLLPIIRLKDNDDRKQYRNSLLLHNRRLKDIAEMIGLSTPLTMYVARHTWASVAKSKNIPISVISEGMGHDSESTTQIYLASLDTAVIDRANNLILKLL